MFAVPDIANPLEVPEAAPQDAAPTQPAARGRSRDETVEADIDERGTLLALRIPDRLLRGAHPGRVCHAVVEAIADGRHQVGQAARERAQARVDLAHHRRARSRR